jgi:hypothetical protein
VTISTTAVNRWGEYERVDVRHVPDGPVSRVERMRRKRLQEWLDGIRFEREKAGLLQLAERVGSRS